MKYFFAQTGSQEGGLRDGLGPPPDDTWEI